MDRFSAAHCTYRYAIVFTKADVSHEQQTNLTADTTKLITDTAELDIEFHEEKILKMLEKLNVSKSPGPDGLHQRILYETRTKITNPLKLIFEASLKLKELPHDWVNANISAIYKKGKSPNYATIGQLVLRVFYAK